MNGCVLLQPRKEQEHVIEVVINRPEALNTLNNEVASLIIDACRSLRADSSAWVVVLRSTGDRAFCAGADLKERNSMSPEDWKHQRTLFRAMYSELRGLPQPLVAVVQGYALGGGTELALSADIIIAATDAVFGLTEPRLGIIPGGGGTQLLPRVVGGPRAMHLLLTGQRFTAEQAQGWGMVMELVDAETLDAATDATIGQILSCSPISTRAIKFAVNAGRSAPLEEAITTENEAYESVLKSADRQEGIAAFNEKREPNWSGR
ncbi:MAG: enoyl-CoA hydratase [Acidimicrobiia bacterium]|nr:enoyl-CoA hydratase [Acidimicrobiia bacterium]